MGKILRSRAVLSGWIGGPGLMTFYHHYETPGQEFTQQDVSAVYARVRTFLDALKAYTATGTATTQIQQCDVLDTGTGELLESFVPAGQAGIANSIAGAMYAPATAALIQWKTSGVVHGHAVKGRTFISPLNAGMVSGGLMIAGAMSGLPSIAAPLIAGGGTEPSLCVWSRPVKVGTPTVPERAGTSWTIEEATTPAKIAVLRSRRD